ncbi:MULTISPECIES: phage major capsid protein [unclassified Hyphomicrobium]|uniref:phage major capsid protein n=1 Tax=unclassified Hyphomicrobium TaxID=2619925 RepID=UPI000213D361|nr:MULTISPECIES: phage major capsid protein [unclassified Hyphomicrobium]CCB65606.1 phage major capsid protein [Hyphomicrobium sp. MC1]
MTDTTTLETKGAGGETARAFEEFLEAFEAFKETNDQRLADIEQRGTSDTLIAEKLARIEETLDSAKRVSDNLALKAARPHLAGGNMSSTLQLAHKAAFDGYVRCGDASRLARIEEKALSAGSGADGGYLVPAETEAAVNSALKAISPMRAISGIRQVSGSVYNRPFATTGVGTGWSAETASRTQTATPTLANLQFPTMELYAMPAASQTLLDDSIVNIDEWLAEEVRIAFAEQEGTAFVSGDGTNKPKGFLAYDTVANASWAWGEIGFVASGAAGAFPASNPGDKILDLVYAAKAPYRANGTFMMSRATVSAVRKLKDGQGNYLWQPANAPGEWPSLLGYPVAESEDMPDIAADATAIAFGDFSRGYLIVDRAGIRVLRDPYSAKPYVLFYTTKRVGGGVQDFDAIKLLKFSA